jgi:maltose alpha-D-glucosyltransferase/alpha-amylase
MHMMFNFQVNQNLFYALAAADSRPLVQALKATKPRPATAQWGLFLRNHDELDLGRLTETTSPIQPITLIKPSSEFSLFNCPIKLHSNRYPRA